MDPDERDGVIRANVFSGVRGSAARRHLSVAVAMTIVSVGMAPVARALGSGSDRALVAAGAIAFPTAIAWVDRDGEGMSKVAGASAAFIAGVAVLWLAPAKAEAHVIFGFTVVVVAMYADAIVLGAVVAGVFVHHRVVAAIDPATITGDMGPWFYATSHTAVVAAFAATVAAVWWLGGKDRQDQVDTSDELREEIAHLDGVMQSSADGVMVVDHEGVLTAHNRRFIEMWRVPQRLIATRDVRRILAAVAGLTKDPNRFLRALRELKERPQDEIRDLHELTDGRVYERTSEPHTVGNLLVGRVWTFRDVTVQKNTEAALREAVGQLEARDESKDLFLTAVSHDMRTPLAAVTGFARLLRDRGDELSDEERAEFIGILVERSERLEQLMLDLLDLDRLSRGILEAKRDAVDLAALVKRVVGGLDLGDRPIVLDTRPVHARVDGPMIERVVENLVVNASKHTPVDTEIRIRLRGIGDDVLLAVEDRGPGISDDLKQTIFQPFVRGEEHEASPGSGVGLSLVARFVELHEGRAWVEDRHGGGSSFRLQLPGVLPEPSIDPAAEAGSGAS